MTKEVEVLILAYDMLQALVEEFQKAHRDKLAHNNVRRYEDAKALLLSVKCEYLGEDKRR